MNAENIYLILMVGLIIYIMNLGFKLLVLASKERKVTRAIRSAIQKTNAIDTRRNTLLKSPRKRVVRKG